MNQPKHSGMTISELERMVEESLPAELRKTQPEDIRGTCEASRTYGVDFTGEDAVECGADGKYRPDVEAVLCNHCYRAVC